MKTINSSTEQMPGWSVPFTMPHAAKGTTMNANVFAIIDTEHHLAEQVEDEQYTAKVESIEGVDSEVSR